MEPSPMRMTPESGSVVKPKSGVNFPISTSALGLRSETYIEMAAEKERFWMNETHYHSFYNMRALGYVDLTCCVIAVVSNAFVILVFTRKTILSPMYTIFTHIAITESFTLIAYAPRAWHEYIRVTKCSIPQHRTYHWEIISLNSYVAAFLFRHTSIWLTVMLAVWRYIAVKYPLKERHWCNLEITRKLIIMGYIFGVTISIIPYFSITVEPTKKLLDKKGCSTSNYSNGENITIYEFQVPLQNYPLLYVVIFGGYAVLLKILPSLGFAVISYKLIAELIEAKKRRREILRRLDCINKTKDTDRTTKILLVILVLFVIGEIPHGIGALFTVYNGPAYFWSFYYYAMEIFNSITHVAQCFNFMIYYAMSKQFRDTFRALSIFNRGNNRSLNIGYRPTNHQLSTTTSTSC